MDEHGEDLNTVTIEDDDGSTITFAHEGEMTEDLRQEMLAFLRKQKRRPPDLRVVRDDDTP